MLIGHCFHSRLCKGKSDAEGRLEDVSTKLGNPSERKPPSPEAVNLVREAAEGVRDSWEVASGLHPQGS